MARMFAGRSHESRSSSTAWSRQTRLQTRVLLTRLRNSTPSVQTCVNSTDRSALRASKNVSTRRVVAARRRPDQPPGVVVDHYGQVAVAPSVSELVDPDPPQPVQPVGLAHRLGRDSGDDRGHDPSAHPLLLREDRGSGTRSQPRAGVLERSGAPCSRSCSQHGRDNDPELRARHPRCVSVQESLVVRKVQRLPASTNMALVKARALSVARRASRAPGPGRPDRGHQHLGTPLALDLVALGHCMFDVKQPLACPDRAHAVPRSVGRGHRQPNKLDGRRRVPLTTRSGRREWRETPDPRPSESREDSAERVVGGWHCSVTRVWVRAER